MIESDELKRAIDDLIAAELSASPYFGAQGSGHRGYELSDEIDFLAARCRLEMEQMAERLRSFVQRCKNDAAQRNYD